MRKATGIVRKIDFLGRLTLPNELRASTGMRPGAYVQIETDQNTIILSKPKKTCCMCHHQDGQLVPGFPYTYVCPNCALVIRGMEERHST